MPCGWTERGAAHFFPGVLWIRRNPYVAPCPVVISCNQGKRMRNEADGRMRGEGGRRKGKRGKKGSQKKRLWGLIFFLVQHCTLCYLWLYQKSSKAYKSCSIARWRRVTICLCVVDGEKKESSNKVWEYLFAVVCMWAGGRLERRRRRGR